jgi:drug/metabolite transporter superfamily protein YnfA
MDAMILIAAFPLELLALFAIWNSSHVARPVGWLIAGCATLLSLAALPVLLTTSHPVSIYLGFAGTYLFSVLAWAWWAEDLPPQRWQFSEVGVALMATAMFALANAK